MHSREIDVFITVWDQKAERTKMVHKKMSWREDVTVNEIARLLDDHIDDIDV